MELSSRGSGESSLQMSSMRMRMSVSLSTTGMENLETRYQISCAIYREMTYPSLSRLSVSHLVEGDCAELALLEAV